MAKIFIETHGCTHNLSDSESMAGLLAEAGHKIVQKESQADLIIINTCTVKTPTEHSMLSRIAQLKKGGKKIIVAGCIPQTDPEKLKGISIIGTSQIGRIAEVVYATIEGKITSLTSPNSKSNLISQKIRKNPIIEIIPISTGCLGACSFCKTKAARGHLRSYPIKEIVQRARQATSEGVKEIWLTSQDTACYGFDIKTNVAYLLKELCRINKDFKIRLGMGNPDHFLKIKEKIAEIMKKEDKIFKFMHIPLQSGNNEVLKGMKRNYSAREYIELIDYFKHDIPNLTLSTDVIVGFPGETNQQFEDTIKTLQKVRPDIANISRFWARDKTPAAKMPDQIPDKEIMARSKKISSIARKISFEKNKAWIGKPMSILIDEVGKGKDNWKGRNDSYKEVLIKGKFKLGEQIYIKIKDATINNLIS